MCRDGWYKGSKQCIVCCVCYVCLLTLSTQRSKHAMHWMLCLSHCWHWCLWLLHNTVYRVMRYENSTLLCIQWPVTPPGGKAIRLFEIWDAMYIDTVDAKHIHTFLPITFLILNWLPIPKNFGKLRLRAFQPYHQIDLLYMPTLLTWGKSISNAFNSIYVEAVDTKHIHTFLPITFLIFNWFSIQKKFWLRLRPFQLYHQILYMLTLSTQGISISNAFTAICAKAVDTFSTQYTHMKWYACWCSWHNRITM